MCAFHGSIAFIHTRTWCMLADLFVYTRWNKRRSSVQCLPVGNSAAVLASTWERVTELKCSAWLRFVDKIMSFLDIDVTLL